MSTEINIEKLYENCIKILTDLIGFKTISGDDNSNLINYCEEYLNKLGATSKKINGIKPIILSGHTDTVPVSKSWSTDPFKATIKDDKLYGRGACDMKGFIACVLAYAPIFCILALCAQGDLYATVWLFIGHYFTKVFKCILMEGFRPLL